MLPKLLKSVTKRFRDSWVDGFHLNYAIMFSEGEATERGFPHYLTIAAFNITLDRQAQAVETTSSE